LLISTLRVNQETERTPGVHMSGLRAFVIVWPVFRRALTAVFARCNALSINARFTMVKVEGWRQKPGILWLQGLPPTFETT